MEESPSTHRRNKYLAIFFIVAILLYIFVFEDNSFMISKALWTAIKALF